MNAAAPPPWAGLGSCSVWSIPTGPQQRRLAPAARLCAISRTLICVEGGFHDPSDFNDRLLPGLKGTIAKPNCTSSEPGSSGASCPRPGATNCRFPSRSDSSLRRRGQRRAGPPTPACKTPSRTSSRCSPARLGRAVVQQFNAARCSRSGTAPVSTNRNRDAGLLRPDLVEPGIDGGSWVTLGAPLNGLDTA
jgi:hypothetical protein